MLNKYIDQYAHQLNIFYADYEAELTSLMVKAKLFNLHRNTIGIELRRMTGALGARVGKAGQKVKRAFVFDRLLEEKERGADLTFHIVKRIGKELCGSGFSNSAVVECFSTSGRTARDRSQMSAADIDRLIALIKPDLDTLSLSFLELRSLKQAEWHKKTMKKSLGRKLLSIAP